jgi:hypothetical protein
MELITKNAGCQLPCWWGFTPGKTEWVEAEHFLDSLVSHMDFTGPYKIEENGAIHTRNTYYFGYPIPHESRGGGANISVIDGTISIIFVNPQSTKYLFTLQQLLNDYGKPDRVYIRTFSNAPSSAIPFYLVVFYQNQRILAKYEVNVIRQLDILQGCFNQTGPQLWVWSEKELVTENRIQDWTMGTAPSSSLKSVEEVTHMNIDEFYNIFKQGGNKKCIETPASFW